MPRVSHPGRNFRYEVARPATGTSFLAAAQASFFLLTFAATRAGTHAIPAKKSFVCLVPSRTEAPGGAAGLSTAPDRPGAMAPCGSHTPRAVKSRLVTGSGGPKPATVCGLTSAPGSRRDPEIAGSIPAPGHPPVPDPVSSLRTLSWAGRREKIQKSPRRGARLCSLLRGRNVPPC